MRQHFIVVGSLQSHSKALKIASHFLCSQEIHAYLTSGNVSFAAMSYCNDSSLMVTMLVAELDEDQLDVVIVDFLSHGLTSVRLSL